MSELVLWSVVDIVALIAGLAFYLFVVGGQLKRIATNLEECAELVRTIKANAEVYVGLAELHRSARVIG